MFVEKTIIWFWKCSELKYKTKWKIHNHFLTLDDGIRKVIHT